MIRIRDYNGYTDWAYVHGLTSVIACSDTCGITACDAFDGRIHGVALFDQLTPNSAQCHIALTNPMRALRGGLLKAAGEYVFNTLNRQVIYGLVPANNAKALAFDKSVGFKRLMVLKDGYARGIDYVLHEMRKENCRWLEQPCKQLELELVGGGRG